MALSWFAIYCSFRAEFTVRDALWEQRLEAYCPSWTIWSKARKDQRIPAPLYPGYLFAGLERDGHGDFPFPAIRSIEGVIGVLGSQGAPIAIAYDPPDPETWRGRSAKDSAEPFSITRLREHEDAGTFDLTKECTRTARRKARQIVRSFSDMARVMIEEERKAA